MSDRLQPLNQISYRGHFRRPSTRNKLSWRAANFKPCVLLLGLTDSASGGAWGRASPDDQAQATLCIPPQSIAANAYHYTRTGGRLKRDASVLNRDGVPSDANPPMAWPMLVNPADEEPHRQPTPPNCLGWAGRVKPWRRGK